MNANATSPPKSGRWQPVLSPPKYPEDPKPAPEPEPVVPADSEPTPKPAEPAPERRSRRSRNYLVAGAAVAVLIAAGGTIAAGAQLVAGGSSPSAAPTAPSLTTVTTTAAAPPSFAEGGECPTRTEANLVQGNGAGGTDSGPAAILAFDYAFYVTRSGAAARAVVAPDAVKVSSAEDIQRGIDSIPQGATHCLKIQPSAPDRFRVELTERRSAGSAVVYRQEFTTVVRDGRTVINTITPIEG